MGRKADPKCLYCAKSYRTEDEAKEKHPECYVGHNCRIKRGRLRGCLRSQNKCDRFDERRKTLATFNSVNRKKDR
jgi:hypothetical protein